MKRSDISIATSGVAWILVRLGGLIQLSAIHRCAVKKPIAIKSALCAFISVCLSLGPFITPGMTGTVPAQTDSTQVINVAVLSFQDESGRMGKKAPSYLARYFSKQLIATSNKELNSFFNYSSAKDWTVENLVKYGQESGAQFVVRPHVMAATSEQVAGKTVVRVQLAADIISVETGRMKRLSVTGVGAKSGDGFAPAIHWNSVDFGSQDFLTSPFGAALTSALSQLAATIYLQIKAGLSVEPNADDSSHDIPVEDTPNEDAAASDTTEDWPETQTDENLQQLLAQAQECLKSANASAAKLAALVQALENLKAALETKAKLLEEGKVIEAEATDGEIAEQAQQLQQAESEILPEDTGDTQSEPTPDTDAGSTGSGESRWDKWFDRITKAVGFAFDVALRIREMRSAYRDYGQEAPGSEQDTGQEEQLGEVNGVITDENGPVEGAQVDVEPMADGDAIIRGDAAALFRSELNTKSNDAVYTNVSYTSPDSTANAVRFVTLKSNNSDNHALHFSNASRAASNRARLSAMTDRNGFYAIRGVPIGRIRLFVTRGGRNMRATVMVGRGRSTPVDVQLNSASSGRAFNSQRAARITPSKVVAGESNANTGTLKGLVQYADGKPLARALIALPGLAVARTDAQGQFVFYKVPARAQQLIIRASGLQPKTESVSVRANKITESRITFGLSEKSPRPDSRMLVPGTGTALRGRIVDAQNRPVVGAKVSVIGLATAAYVRTRTDGGYELRDLKPGSFNVLVTKVGYGDATATVSLRSGQSEQRDFRLKQLQLNINPNALRNYAVNADEVRKRKETKDGIPAEALGRAGGHLTGQVRDAKSGKLISDAVISIQGRSARTDRDGRYSITNLLPGRLQVRAMKNGYESGTETVDIKSGSSRSKNIDLRPSSEARTEERRETSNGNIMGRVTDEKTGRAITGATVYVTGRGALTDRSGSYVVDNVPTGRHRISITKSGYQNLSRTVEVRSDDTKRQDFALRATENRDSSFPEERRSETRDGNLSGRVVDAKTDRPISGATVSLQGRSHHTDRDGNFSIIGLPPGNYRVRATGNGYFTDEKSVEIRPGRATNREFELSPLPNSNSGPRPGLDSSFPFPGNRNSNSIRNANSNSTSNRNSSSTSNRNSNSTSNRNSRSQSGLNSRFPFPRNGNSNSTSNRNSNSNSNRNSNSQRNRNSNAPRVKPKWPF